MRALILSLLFASGFAHADINVDMLGGKSEKFKAAQIKQASVRSWTTSDFAGLYLRLTSNDARENGYTAQIAIRENVTKSLGVDPLALAKDLLKGEVDIQLLTKEPLRFSRDGRHVIFADSINIGLKPAQ